MQLKCRSFLLLFPCDIYFGYPAYWQLGLTKAQATGTFLHIIRGITAGIGVTKITHNTEVEIVLIFLSLVIVKALKVEVTINKCKLNMNKTTSTSSVLKFVKLSENAYTPTKGSTRAAGYDLKSAYDYIIPANGKAVVKTDIQIRVPEGTYGRIAPRSGLAAKHHLDVGAGVVDEDYTGNVRVVLFNHGAEEFKIAKGDRIAQLICEKIRYPVLEECVSIEETERGPCGFGSTDTNNKH